MPISTRLTELFRIKHPILLAPMDIVAVLGNLGRNPI
jgi:NAD(P)H-dependent flavin oxidoreductase YrpB (nitropropane dioxygenase family)